MLTKKTSQNSINVLIYYHSYEAKLTKTLKILQQGNKEKLHCLFKAVRKLKLSSVQNMYIVTDI